MSRPLGRDEIRETLRRIGAAPDDDIDLTETALALAALERPRVPLDWYRAHLDQLAHDVAELAGAANGADDAAAALRTVIAGNHGYQGDQLTYEDIQNANLMRVIDRRKGLPVALGIIYIHAARLQGWSMVGLNFPGHFLVRLEVDGERTILDPFSGGQARAAAELRDLLKVVAGVEAELTPELYAPVRDRDVLLRLQNNLKIRHIQAQAIEPAARVVEGMLLIAPNEAPLWRESALLNARLGNLGAAIQALETFMRIGTDPEGRHQAAVLLQQLKSHLN